MQDERLRGIEILDEREFTLLQTYQDIENNKYA